MADTNNNSGNVFGSTAEVNAGSALEAVQAEQIRRLEQDKQQREAATPAPLTTSGPLTAAQMMQEAAQEAQARTKTSEARAAGFDSGAGSPAPPPAMPPPIPVPPSASKNLAAPRVWDAAAANARAASRPYAPAPRQDAGFFDAFAYDEALQAQRMQAAGESPPAGGWDSEAGDARVAASPAYSASSGDADLWADRDGRGRVDAGMGSLSAESTARLEALRTSTTASAITSREPIASAAPQRPSPPRYASAKEARDLGALLRTGLEDDYALAGRVPEIDGAQFHAELKAQQIEAALIAPDAARPRGLRGALANMREDFAEPYGKLNYGYALAQSGQEAGQYYEKTQAGQYLTSEQKATAAAGFLPGVGALAGTAIGSMIAPGVGSWVGGMVGAGAGAAAQGVIGANEERGQATREAAERLAASLGQAADSIGTFKSQLEATGAPIQQLAQGLSALQASGPGVGPEAVAGAGRAALAEGEYYGANTASTSKFLSSSPALAPLAQLYRHDGSLTRGQYQSVAQLALAEGDTGEFNSAMLQASTATLTNDAAYQGAARRLETDKNSPVLEARHWFDSLAVNKWFAGTDGVQDGDYIAGAQKQMEDRKKALGLQDGADTQKYVNQFASINQGRQGLIDAGLNVKIGQAGLATAEAAGAGAAEMRRLAPGINASLDAATAADQTLISTDTGLMNGLTAASDPTGSLRTSYQTLINQARADQVQNPLAKAQLARSVFDTGLQEDESAYGLTLTTAQSGLTRGLLSGRRYDQLAGDENGIVSAENARADQLRRSAYNPLVRPAERSQMLAQADSLETGALEQQHGFLLSGYSQNLARTDLQGAQAGLAVTNAQITGGPQDVYTARGQELAAYTAKIAELGNELAKGGLTVDERVGKERELSDTRRQAAQAQDTQRQAYLADQEHLTGTRTETASVGLDRTLRRGGNAAFDPAILALDREAEAQAQSRLDFDKRTTPGNVQRLAGDALRVRQAQEAVQQSEDVKNDYRPTGAFARQMASDRTAFEVALQAPYIRGGAESDPLTRGNAVIKDLRQDMAQNEASRLRGQRDGTWTDDNETAYSQHKNEDSLQLAAMEREKRFALFSAIPNTIIGGGGGVGNSVQSFSFDALTAAYAPNELVGSRGRPNIPRGGELPGSLPGSRVDAFERHAGITTAAAGTGGSPASLTTAIQNLTHGMNTQQLAALLTQLVQSNQELVRLVGSGQKLPSQSGPPLTGGSRTIQDNRQSANTNRPSQR